MPENCSTFRCCCLPCCDSQRTRDRVSLHKHCRKFARSDCIFPLVRSVRSFARSLNYEPFHFILLTCIYIYVYVFVGVCIYIFMKYFFWLPLYAFRDPCSDSVFIVMPHKLPKCHQGKLSKAGRCQTPNNAEKRAARRKFIEKNAMCIHTNTHTENYNCNKLLNCCI